MGEVGGRRNQPQTDRIQPRFNRAIRVEARSDRLSADTGSMVLRELMELTGVVDWMDGAFRDLRTKDMITHSNAELLRTQLLLLAQGWTDADDADRLRADPMLRLSVSDRRGEAPLRDAPQTHTPEGLPSQPSLSRLIARASTPDNRAVLDEAVCRMAVSRCQLIDRRLRHDHLVVDVDALPMPVHGHQEGARYNGYFRQTGYHPLIMGSAQTGELYGGLLRPGNASAAQGIASMVAERLDWIQEHLARHVTLRFDAGAVSGGFLDLLEQRPRTSYVARIKTNAVLERKARAQVAAYQRDLARDPATLQAEGFRCHELSYQATPWTKSRRVVLVLIPSEQDELPIEHHFFLVTNDPASVTPGPDLVELYRQRGTFEQMLGELCSTLRPQLSSTTRPKQTYRGTAPRRPTASRDAFAANQVILTLNLLAYNLMHLGRQAAERSHRRPGRPRTYGRSSPAMSLDTFRQRYLRVASRISLHSRRVGVTIARAVADDWDHLWRLLARLDPVVIRHA